MRVTHGPSYLYYTSLFKTSMQLYVVYIWQNEMLHTYWGETMPHYTTNKMSSNVRSRLAADILSFLFYSFRMRPCFELKHLCLMLPIARTLYTTVGDVLKQVVLYVKYIPKYRKYHTVKYIGYLPKNILTYMKLLI